MCGVHIVILYHSFLAIIPDVIEALNHCLDAQWWQFGSFLHVAQPTLDCISKDNSNVASCMLQLVEKWLCHETGTGDLPRTWETVVQAAKDIDQKDLAAQLEQRYGVSASGKHKQQHYT